VALGTLLQRMKLTLSDHSARRSRGTAAEPMIVPAASRAAAGGSGAIQPLSA
jgi:hypothetical protein